jgi:DNA-binding winged helix-turn-helix (wHTH) protein
MSRVYRFADCRIDPARRELWRAQQLVPLPPQVFDFLAYLVEHHDRAVGRDELVAAVWGKTEISDTLLGQTVLRLRRELGDDAKEQRLLRTIPRFGYRWVAPLDAADNVVPVVTHDAAPAPAPLPLPLLAPIPDRRYFGRWASAAAVLVVMLAIGAIARWRNPHDAAIPPRYARSSVVLPAQVDASAEWAWTRLGVMDMVASRLRSSGVPSVPSETVVAWLHAPTAAQGDIRAATRAALVITPQVQRGNDDWTVRLDADNGAGQRYAVEGHGSDVSRAARAATETLLTALGTNPSGAARDAPDSEFIRRVDAAVLADDPQGARQLIDAASDEQRRSPELRLRLAKLDFRAGKLDEARQRLTALLDEAPAQSAPLLRASILNGLGAVAIRADDPGQASAHFDAAIDLLARQADPQQLGQAYLGRAAAAADQHRFEAASADYARARIAYREANDALALVRIAADEGFVDLDLDRPAQALSQLQSAADAFQQWGALNEAIYASIGQIDAHLSLLDAAAALRVADAAGAFAQRLENPDTRTSLTLARARALIASGRLREAHAALDEAQSATHDPVALALAGVSLARLDLDAGNPASAAELTERAIAALDAPSYSRARADAWLIHARALQAMRETERATATLAAFAAWAQHGDEQRAHVYAQLARAEQAQRTGPDAGWRDEFAAARQLAERTAVPLEIASVARSHADALIAAGDLQAAAVEIGRVSRWAETDFSCAVLEARLYAALGNDAARQNAVARARTLAGERTLPADTLALTIPAQSAAAR